jgi:hypothetical protein
VRGLVINGHRRLVLLIAMDRERWEGSSIVFEIILVVSLK